MSPALTVVSAVSPPRCATAASINRKPPPRNNIPIPILTGVEGFLPFRESAIHNHENKGESNTTNKGFTD